MRPQDSTSSQRHGDDRNYPPPSSSSNLHYQEISHPYKSRGGVSPQLDKSIPMDTQGPRPNSSSRMTRTPSTFLPGPGPQPTGTQFESGLASGTSRMLADRPEQQPRFPSTLQRLLSNDFGYVVRWRTVSHNNCCIIIHRFRILVVGKVCIMYHTQSVDSTGDVSSQPGSGKSSLINTIFNVDMSVCTRSSLHSFPTLLCVCNL